MRSALVVAVVAVLLARAAHARSDARGRVGRRGDAALPRLVDHDATAGCLAEEAAHRAALATAATTGAPAWTPPPCRHHAALRADHIELLEPIAFEYDKATLRPASRPVLDDVAAILLARPELHLEIQGHGPEQPYRARSLTGDRAASVRAYLVHRGIDAARLVAQGYGDTVPLVPADHPDAARRNRRIELRLLPPP